MTDVTDANMGSGDALESMHNSGKINDFMYKMVQKALPVLTPDMATEILDDAMLATQFQVNTQDEYVLFHNIDTFTDQLIDEIIGAPISTQDKNDLKRFIFNQKEELDFGDLASFRVAIMKWLKNRKENSLNSKTAYPNRGEIPLKMKSTSVSRWAELAHHVRNQIVMGSNEYEALVNTSSYLPQMERLDFMAWYKFRYGKDRVLYDVNKNIRDESEGLMDTVHMRSRKKTANKVAFFAENETKYFLPELKPVDNMPDADPAHIVREKERQDQFQIYRSKLVARTFAIDKLLEKYRDLFSDKQVMEIETALNTLRTQIRMLAYAESVVDSMIKTSGILRKNKFMVGSDCLISMAEEVSGKKIKKEAADLNLEGLQTVLNDLYNISNYLKRRDVVRQIAGIDLKLHDMMISSFFPEISEAQSKLIDAFGYAANKLEDVMPKIRTSVNKPAEGPPQLAQVEQNPEAIAEEQAIQQSGKPPKAAQEPMAPSAPQPPKPSKTPNPEASQQLAKKINEG